eukprot:754737-Hanusia_phi.AAC.1
MFLRRGRSISDHRLPWKAVEGVSLDESGRLRGTGTDRNPDLTGSGLAVPWLRVSLGDSATQCWPDGTESSRGLPVTAGHSDGAGRPAGYSEYTP